MSDFQSLFQHHLERRGLTIYRLSKELQIDRSTLYQVHSGARLPTVQIFQRMAAYFELSSQEEREWIRAGKDPDKRVIQIWALRESYMKKTGEGLGLSLEAFSMLPPGGWEPSLSAGAAAGFRVTRQGRKQPERLWLLEPVPGYALAVCGQEELAWPVPQVTEGEAKEFFGWNGKS